MNTTEPTQPTQQQNSKKRTATDPPEAPQSPHPSPHPPLANLAANVLDFTLDYANVTYDVHLEVIGNFTNLRVHSIGFPSYRLQLPTVLDLDYIGQQIHQNKARTARLVIQPPPPHAVASLSICGTTYTLEVEPQSVQDQVNDLIAQVLRMGATIEALQRRVTVTESALPPIGSASGWHKSVAEGPVLNGSYRQCNGDVLDLPGSPIHGQEIPDLNRSVPLPLFIGRTPRGSISFNNLIATSRYTETTVGLSEPLTSGSWTWTAIVTDIHQIPKRLDWIGFGVHCCDPQTPPSAPSEHYFGITHCQSETHDWLGGKLAIHRWGKEGHPGAYSLGDTFTMTYHCATGTLVINGSGWKETVVVAVNRNKTWYPVFLSYITNMDLVKFERCQLS